VHGQNGGVQPPQTDAWDDVLARVSPDPVTGLVAAVAQQWDTGEVLMLAWMDREALRRTLATGRATYWSRSRQEYWVKGDTSGHAQRVRSVRLDCDGDTVLLAVDQVGAACHTGDRTCFDADLLLELPAGDAHLSDADSSDADSSDADSSDADSSDADSSDADSSDADSSDAGPAHAATTDEDAT
jgi:phosphoribosyl-AMP cyclohydrolase